jgi:hypothetical protein
VSDAAAMSVGIDRRHPEKPLALRFLGPGFPLFAVPFRKRFFFGEKEPASNLPFNRLGSSRPFVDARNDREPYPEEFSDLGQRGPALSQEHQPGFPQRFWDGPSPVE